jgi:hypothetical protein
MEHTTSQKNYTTPTLIAVVVLIVIAAIIYASVRGSATTPVPQATGSPSVSPTSTASAQKPVATVVPKPVSSVKPKPTATAAASVKPATTTQPVSLLAPNGGEKIKKGSHFAITWKTTSQFVTDYPQVSLTLVAGNQNDAVQPQYQIITANTGSYDWFVPSTSFQANIQDITGAYRMTNLDDKQVLRMIVEGYPRKTGQAEITFDISNDYFTLTNY